MNVIFDMIDNRDGRRFNEWIDYPGFKSLYIRYGNRYYDGKVIKAFDIANVTAENPGNGAFRRLVKDVRERYPDLFIYVESVQNERFRNRLIKMGFSVDCVDSMSFWLAPGAQFFTD